MRTRKEKEAVARFVREVPPLFAPGEFEEHMTSDRWRLTDLPLPSLAVARQVLRLAYPLRRQFIGGHGVVLYQDGLPARWTWTRLRHLVVDACQKLDLVDARPFPSYTPYLRASFQAWALRRALQDGQIPEEHVPVVVETLLLRR